MRRLEAAFRWLHDPVIAGHPRYRAWERRHLLAAVRGGALTLAAVQLTDCVLLYGQAPNLIAINGPGALIPLLVYLAMRKGGRARRVPAAGAFVLGIVAVGSTLLAMGLMPAVAPKMVAYMPIVIIASALFVPWSISRHVPWLLLANASVVAFAGSSLATTIDVDARQGLISITISATLVSFAGHAILQRERRDAFHHRLQLRGVNQMARRQRRELQALADQLESVARRDPLTGIGNRLRLDEDVAEMSQTTTDDGRRVAAVLIDIDHFKPYNDRHGHLAGDAILREVARTIAINLRPRDRVYRYGGEEFLVLLDDTDATGALVVAERLREAVGALRIPHPHNRPWDVITVSAGVASVGLDGESDEWIGEADARLYAAKAAGRNRTVGEPDTTATVPVAAESAA